MWLETIPHIHLSSFKELLCDLGFTPSYSYTSLYCPKAAPQQLHCLQVKCLPLTGINIPIIPDPSQFSPFYHWTVTPQNHRICWLRREPSESSRQTFGYSANMWISRFFYFQPWRKPLSHNIFLSVIYLPQFNSVASSHWLEQKYVHTRNKIGKNKEIQAVSKPHKKISQETTPAAKSSNCCSAPSQQSRLQQWSSTCSLVGPPHS